MHPAFAVHMLNEKGKQKAAAIAGIFDNALAALQGLCPAGRELSIVVTKLEEAAFFAKKAMANDPTSTGPSDYAATLSADGGYDLR